MRQTNAALAVVEAHERGYWVDEDGNLISPRGTMRKLRTGRWGRLSFNIKIGGLSCCVRVHQLAAYQLFGEDALEEGIQVRHLDGDYTNNTAWNLGLGTQSDNMMDQPEGVRQARARHAGMCRSPLTEDDVLDIRALFAEGCTGKRITEIYGISKSTASYIKNRVTWAWL